MFFRADTVRTGAYWLSGALGLILFGIAVSQAAAPQSTPPDEQVRMQIMDLNDKLSVAIRTGDVSTLDPILADNFVYTNQTGELISKMQMLANIQSGRLTTIAQRYSDYDLKQYGDTVVLTGISKTSLVYRGKPSDGPRRFTRIFIRRDGKWLLIAQHVTLVSKD